MEPGARSGTGGRVVSQRSKQEGFLVAAPLRVRVRGLAATSRSPREDALR